MRLAGLGALALAGALVTAATAQGAAPATPVAITGPAAHAFLRGEGATVVARVPASVATAAVVVNGLRTDARCARGTCRARITRAQRLRPGANIVKVRATAPGMARGQAAVLFDAGRRVRGLATIRVPKAAGGVLVIRTRVPRARQIRFAVTLNGRRIERRLDGQPGPVYRLRLGADDGLRHGRNRVRVFLARRDGSYSVASAAFRIDPRAPIAGAGRDRIVRGRTPVTLDARRSAPGRGGSLAYAWSVVTPTTPLLPLQGTTSPTLQITPPAVGRYRLKLTVTQRGGPRAGAISTDYVTLTSQPVTPPIGVPVTTGGTSGGAPAVMVGSTAYPLAPGDAVIAVALDRATLQQVLPTTSFAAGEASTAQSYISQAASSSDNSVIVILANPSGNALGDSGWAKVVSTSGATPVAGFFNGETTGFSAIGVPGDDGNGFQAFPPSGISPTISGYLQVASNGVRYRFARGDYPAFDTSSAAGALSNTMTIDGADYASAPLPSCAKGGFQVVIVSAIDLSFQESMSIPTNGCSTDAADQLGLIAGITSLAQLHAPALVFVQSIGQPRDPGPSWAALATDAIARIGGTAEVFYGAGTGGGRPYALVGSLGSPTGSGAESSASLGGGAGAVSGLLRRTHSWTYAPTLGVPGDSAPMAPAIAYQASTPWPLSTDAGDAAAMNDIAQRLGLVPDDSNSCEMPAPPGPRGLYCTDEGWANQRISLKQLTYQPTTAYDAATFTAVQGQLDTEFDYVADMYEAKTQQTAVLGTQAKGAKVDLNDITGAIVTNIDASGVVSANLSVITGDVLNAMSYLTSGIAAPVMSELSTILQLSADSAENPASGLPLDEQVQVRAKDLGSQLDAYYQGADDGVGHVVDLMVSDWGKLSAAHASPAFQPYSNRTAESVQTYAEASVSGWIWGQLMPLAYQLNVLRSGTLNSNPTNPSTYTCSQQGAFGPVVKYHPFGSLNPVTAAQYTTPLVSRNVVNQRTVLPSVKGATLPGDKTFFSEFPSPPPAAQMTTLFQPIAQGGLGQFPSEFFPRWLGTDYKAISC